MNTETKTQIKTQLPTYQEPDPYCKIGGKKQLHQPEAIFELVLADFFKGPIDPKTYFVTSGEAVRKAEQLEKDLWYAAGQARKLKNLLKVAREKAVYLETEWNADARLILKRKNPRNKDKDGNLRVPKVD
jgi:hypothetical protein